MGSSRAPSRRLALRFPGRFFGNKEWLFPRNIVRTLVRHQSAGSRPDHPGPSTNQGRPLLGSEHRRNMSMPFSPPCAGPNWKTPGKPNRAPDQSSPTLLARRVEQPNGLLTRGVGGTRTNAEAIDVIGALGRIHPGQGQPLNVASPAMESTGSFLALERWFRHTE